MIPSHASAKVSFRLVDDQDLLVFRPTSPGDYSDGTFYMLPRTNSGGVAGMKPICTHGKRISDFCSWRGLLVLAGDQTTPIGDANRIRKWLQQGIDMAMQLASSGTEATRF